MEPNEKISINITCILHLDNTDRMHHNKIFIISTGKGD